MAIIAILMTMLLPALGKAKSVAKLAACTNNLKQVGVMMAIYNGDFDGFLTCHKFGSSHSAWGQKYRGMERALSDYSGFSLASNPGYGAGGDTYTCPNSPVRWSRSAELYNHAGRFSTYNTYEGLYYHYHGSL